MKLESKNIGLLAVIVAISIGATYAFTYQITLESFGSPSQSSGAFMTGHVTAVVHDEFGNIIAYRQADNEIVLGGMDIIASQVFKYDAVGNNTNHTGGRVGWMSIGNNTGNTPPAAADNELDCPLEKAGIAKCGAGFGQLDTPRASCVGERAEIGTSRGRVNLNGDAQVNVTAVATFDGAVCSSINIREAGMWNNATSTAIGDLFARNTFGSVTLTTTDSLELTWRFTFTDN